MAEAPFIVCSQFTPDYRGKRDRLAASLERFGLAHELMEVPQVHRSISPRGSADMAASKPRFITSMLKRFGKPVLYVDSDMVFRKRPDLITALCAQDCDFAIYNWLADPMNDAWRPEPGGRQWKFYFGVDVASDSQLMASGAVQLWRGSEAAFTLLADWEQSLLGHPRSEDDHCLDFAYNHGDRSTLKPHWLPKEYVRIGFWIYADPVIDHPELPTPIIGHFEQLGSARFRTAELRRVTKQTPFPRDAIVDAENSNVPLFLPEKN